MARYRPQESISIAEPCSEEWEEMDGDARIRHCAHCDRDVHNLAAMTPSQIEALMLGPGPLPCLRMARFDDGSLLVAEEGRSLPRFGALAGAATTALVSIVAATASAQSSHKGYLVMGRTVAQAVYTGQVLGPDGKPAPGAHVYVSRTVAGKEDRVEVTADTKGGFRLQATPGDWKVGASGVSGPAYAQPQSVTLHSGEQRAAKPLLLEPITVTAGIPLPPPVKAKPANKKP